MAAEGYKIRKSKAGSTRHPYTAYSVTVPAEIANAIANIEDRRFVWEWDDRGLLLRELSPGNENGHVPSWAGGEGA